MYCVVGRDSEITAYMNSHSGELPSDAFRKRYGQDSSRGRYWTPPGKFMKTKWGDDYPFQISSLWTTSEGLDVGFCRYDVESVS